MMTPREQIAIVQRLVRQCDAAGTLTSELHAAAEALVADLEPTPEMIAAAARTIAAQCDKRVDEHMAGNVPASN